MTEKPVFFEVTDIEFKISKHGNLQPRIVIGDPKLEFHLDLPNVYMLQSSGIMIGDCFEAEKFMGKLHCLDIREAIDRSPPIIPTHCPCCREELSINYGRHTVIKCLNTVGCSAQNQ